LRVACPVGPTLGHTIKFIQQIHPASSSVEAYRLSKTLDVCNPPAPTASHRWLLKDRAYSELKQKIQAGDYPPGTFLSERQLSSLLGMSKTPIKAALERLEQEGLVTVAPQQGIVVRAMTIQEVVDQFELRKALECYVISALSGKLTKSQNTTIERNVKQQRKAASKNLCNQLVELDAEFHLILCQAFGNAAILDCLMQHRAKMHRVISQVMSQNPARWNVAVEEHAAILLAIQNSTGSKAVKLMEQHLDYGKQYLLASKWE
jgi:DNA-binding GntR family transcriptional regulator